MNIQELKRPFTELLFIALLWLTGTGTALAQFTQNRDTIRIDASSYPPDVQTAFGIFRVKCGECHGLDKSLKPSMSSEKWATVLKRMQAMASSHISDQEAQTILTFLNYDELHRKAQPKTAAAPAGSDSIARGREFYSAQGCDACHTIAGKGGDAAPPLTKVGAKLSRDQLLTRMKGRRAGAVMPALPPETTDAQINDLVDFLMTLK